MPRLGKRKQAERFTWEVAHHEAGHVVLSKHFGFPIDHVYIGQNRGEWAGETVFARVGINLLIRAQTAAQIRRSIEVDPSLRGHVLNFIRVSFAGMQVDKLITGKVQPSWMYRDDLETAEIYADATGIGREGLEEARREAGAMVKRPEHEGRIRNLAGALYRAKRLNGEEIDRCLA